MPCSRMPKCSTRPAYGSVFHMAVERIFGPKDGAPSIVVLFEPARSAEPPHSSGTRGAIALMTAPEALRVATPFGSASHVGRSASQPSGRVRVCSRSKRATSAEGLRVQRWNLSSQAACASLPRSTARRVWAITSGATSKVCSGSNPSTFLVAATSSSPRAEPWASPVFWADGAGQAMIVRRTMRLGWSVTDSALRRASCSAGTSSRYWPPPWVQSTTCTCQP